MSLRTKLVVLLVAVTATATIAVGAVSVVATSQRLHSEVDRSLEQAAEVVQARPGFTLGGPWFSPDRRRSETVLPIAELEQVAVQVIDRNGDVVAASSDTVLPVDDADTFAAAHDRGGVQVLRTVQIDGEPYRILTVPGRSGRTAIQVARNLDETERLVQSQRAAVLFTVLVVTVVAALAGWILARQITRRLVRLTTAAEQVSTTGDVDISVPVEGKDETGRLALAFDRMLAALSASKAAQQRLVQDAGHELRTPLTSLRTNVSVLRRHDDLDAVTREQILSDIDAETRQLTTLVDEIVELATDSRRDEAATTLALGDLVSDVVDRARRRSGRVFDVHTDDTTVTGRRLALERAVTNLLDNAAKFDESGAPIDVVVDAGRVDVADRGVGIGAEESSLVFERFHRSITARSTPGSGLGLSIVKAIVESHGGTVYATPREGGGSHVGFVLPTDAER